MLDFDVLPTVRERDGESGGENEVHFLQSSPQKASMPTNESEDVEMTDQAPIEGRSQGQPSSDTPDLQITSVMTLRSASKRQGKFFNDGKPRKNDHKAKASSFEENLANAKADLQSCRSNLEDAQNKLAASKEDSRNTKTQLTGTKKELATCRRNLKDSKANCCNLKRANRDLQDNFTASQKELTKCRDDLFRLERAAQIPDSTISERFEFVSQQIVHWIDAESAAEGKAHPEAELDHMFSAGEDKDAIRFLRDHPGFGEYLAGYLIHRFLQDNVFGGKVFFFGLPEETAQLLQKAELLMAKFDPQNDSVTIARWRSETLKALAMTTEYKHCYLTQSQNLNIRLFEELSMALPNLFSGRQNHTTFYDQVLLPAVKLAKMIRMSTSDYVFLMPGSPNTKFKPITTDMLKVQKMMDSKSGKQLKPDSAVVADKDGIIGDLVICLEPGLYRRNEGKETTLRQLTFLIKLNHPLGKRSKPSA